MTSHETLRIVHCVRSPVGGIFRHIADLATAQAAAGHQVGLICDSSTGGAFEDAAIERLSPSLALGVVRFPMRRQIGPWDLPAVWKLASHLAPLEPDILHAHGAKGGAFARLVGTWMKIRKAPVGRFYCPHGGSLHYDAASLKGRLYFFVERQLARLTDGLVFVSDYERKAFEDKVGAPPCPVYRVPNGLRPEEFEPVGANPNAVDFLFIGMLRDLKGPDVFIDAIARLRDSGRPATALVVGDGPDREAYRQKVRDLGLEGQIEFRDPMPAREAFALAKTVAVPSRAESMPYIVLETLAAGKPLIATLVGGIPEIFAEKASALIEPGNPERLAEAMADALDHPDLLAAETEALRRSVRERYSLERMAGTVEAAYRAFLEADGTKPARNRPERKTNQVNQTAGDMAP